ncbi:hypothetical protein JTB14_033841 [Gonioctena quinquepunctata]|nr:hypothetical protein JTB14_033841 [Gonioctena quinquepunctata]
MSSEFRNPYDLPELIDEIPKGIRVKSEYSNLPQEWQNNSGFFNDEPYTENISEIEPRDYHLLINSKTEAYPITLPSEIHSRTMTTDMEHVTSVISKGSYEPTDLRNILSKYAEGKHVLKMAELKHTELPSALRQIVVDKIVDYFLQIGKTLNVAAGSTLARQIKRMFPGEIEEYYFAPQPGRAPKGKLVAKFYNQLRKLKISGLVSSRNKKKIAQTEIEPIPEVNSVEIKQKLKSIQVNDRMEERKLFLEYKSLNLSSFFVEWPGYRQPTGYTLVTLDFEYLFPNAKQIFAKWDLFAQRVFKVFNETTKEKKCRQILSDYESGSFTDDERNVLILYIIHGALVPTSKRTITEGERKIIQRFTISDSQDSFVVFGKSTQEIEEKLARNTSNSAMQPLLRILHGEKFYQTKNITVCFDCVKYQFQNIISALDCCFKIYKVFDLKYPLACGSVWQFIQLFFYGIKSQHDIVHPNLSIFMNSINKIVTR